MRQDAKEPGCSTSQKFRLLWRSGRHGKRWIPARVQERPPRAPFFSLFSLSFSFFVCTFKSPSRIRPTFFHFFFFVFHTLSFFPRARACAGVKIGQVPRSVLEKKRQERKGMLASGRTTAPRKRETRPRDGNTAGRLPRQDAAFLAFLRETFTAPTTTTTTTTCDPFVTKRAIVFLEMQKKTKKKKGGSAATSLGTGSRGDGATGCVCPLSYTTGGWERYRCRLCRAAAVQ